MSQIHYDWWEPVECLDGTGSVESMCLLLRDETESGDQLRITIENHGEYTAEVVATKTAPGTAMVGVEIEPDSTLGSQGIIELPAPHRGDYPTFRYKQDPPEPTPAIIGGDSEEIAYVVRRENVTAVEKLEHHLETT
jgi:hypothetical protein